jgi:hypothetical protein
LKALLDREAESWFSGEPSGIKRHQGIRNLVVGICFYDFAFVGGRIVGYASWVGFGNIFSIWWRLPLEIFLGKDRLTSCGVPVLLFIISSCTIY